MAQANTILPKDVTGTKNKTALLIPVGRTLPREIMKWIQGLDLSYSVKDPKRDLGNGFLIAEIFSRYYPGRVQMHSYDNSHNTQRRINNWNQLNLFFIKEDLPFAKENFDKIIEDNEWPQLFNFVTNIYMNLTKRKVSDPPLVTFINSKDYYSSSITEGGTQSFLLKDKGLERLDQYKDELKAGDVAADQKEQNSEKQAQLSVSSKRTNFLRVPSKPISQNIENLNYQIDVKNIQIRPVQGNIMKVREQQLALSNENEMSNQYPQKQQLNGLQDSFQKSMLDTQIDKKDGTGPKDKQLEKTIYEVLNQTIMMRMQSPQFQEDMKKFKVKNNTLVQAFIDQIEMFSDEFSGGFFLDILRQKDNFMNIISKDTNDLWKFFNFTFQCLANLPVDREAFRNCIELIHQFGQKALQKDANKTRYIFTEFFLPQICQLIKDCILFEKKEMIIQLIYSFCPQEPLIRHQVIAVLKDNITSVGLFMQILTVLIKFETVYTENQKQLFQDYINYAQIHLFSQAPALSSCALSIFAHIAEINPSFVHVRLFNKVGQIARNKWWQNRCLAIVLFSALIKGVIATPSYQTLIKAPAQGQKFFSMDNDRLISDLKNQVSHFAEGIFIASKPASSDMLLSTTLIYIVDLLGDSAILLDLFTRMMLDVGPELRQWVLYGGLDENDNCNNDDESMQIKDNFMFVVPSDKSFKYKTNINSKIIQQFASKILINLVDKLKVTKPPSLSAGQFQILHYCFEFTDFKVMNMESCEQVAKLTKEYIYLGMCDNELCLEAADLVRKLLDLQYKAEVTITDQEQLFCQCITLILRGEQQKCLQNLLRFLDLLTDEACQSGNEGLKSFLKIVHQNMMEIQPSPLQNQSIAKTFEKIVSMGDDGQYSQSGFGSPLGQPANHIPSQIDEDMEISAVDRQQEEYLEEGALEDGEFDEEEEQDEVLDVQD